ICSCEHIEKKYFNFDYPGNKFSRDLSYAVATRKAPGNYVYEMERGKVELLLNEKHPSIIDHRSGKPQKFKISTIHYEKRIDNSLRYFLREGMNLQEIQKILGEPFEKWGGPVPNMYVWRMADKRHVAIMPSVLEMPEGMQSFNLFNEFQKLDRTIKLIPLGSSGK
ncbi:MAG: hypothetical protein HRU21_12270, partial [Pseudomonadales bacterium]|nr:hypothetical protein [Pseudomonadales bacterium]